MTLKDIQPVCCIRAAVSLNIVRIADPGLFVRRLCVGGDLFVDLLHHFSGILTMISEHYVITWIQATFLIFRVFSTTSFCSTILDTVRYSTRGTPDRDQPFSNEK